MRKSLLLLCFFWSVLIGRVFGQSQTVVNGSAVAPVHFTGAGCSFTWVNDQPSIGLAASGVGDIASFTASNPGSAPITATITVTPIPVVYAYIPNEQDNTVSVVNAVNGALAATIPVGTLPDAESVSPDGSTVYISNEGSDNVSVINTATNTVIATIPIGFPARGIVVNHAGTMVYVADGKNVKVISTASNAVVGTLSSGGPFGIAIDPTDEYVYTVDYADPGVVKQIDVADNITTFNVAAGNESYGVSVSPDGSRLYVTNTQGVNVTVIDVATMMVIATVPVGRVPSASAVSPDGTKVYVTNSVDGTVSVIDATTNTVTATIACGYPANTPNISADGKVLYVTANNNLIAISTAANTILWTTAVGQGPQAIGNFLTPATCSSAASTFTITVDPSPNVTASTVAGYISACAGTASSTPAIQQFKVNATTATGSVTATAPAGFEVSLSLNSGYGNSVTLTPLSGVINNVPVYVRSGATAPAGNISGNITLTEGGLKEQTIAVTGFISSPPTVDQAANQVVQNGAATAAVNFTGTGNAFAWTNDMPAIGLAADGTGNIPSFTAINTGTTPIVATVSVTVKNAGFAYVGQTTTNTVTVINTSTHAVVGNIGVGNDPYGMWQTPNGGLLYVANVQSNSLSVINTAAQAVTSTIHVGQKPVGIVGSVDGSILYVVEQGDNKVSVINTATQTVTATIAVGTFPEAICMSLDGSALYVTNQLDNSISVISTATNAVTGTIAVGSNPDAICISPDGTKLYEVNDADNNLYVISTATNSVVNTIPVGSQPHNLTISADGSTVYTANQGVGTISVVNTVTGQVTATIPVGSYPDGTALSPDGSALWVTNLNSSSVIAINTATNTVTNTIAVGADPGSLGNFVGNSGCPSQPMVFTIKINPTAPSVVVTSSLTPMTTVYGTASAASSFVVSGSNLTAGILVAPPPGFEVSVDDATYSGTVTVGGSASVPPTMIYIRLAAATPVSSYTGNIIITSSGATTQDVAIPASDVTPARLTITANDATRPYGQPNPGFTFTYSGFQNNETEAALVSAPQATTTAIESSPAGDYPIIPAGAEDSNYSFTYSPGTLKITPVSMAVSIPNAFTPNGDGKNDTWGIKNLSSYPNCRVTVFNRYGQAVFASTGYGEPWNGRQNGTDVPSGTYVYIIDLGNSTKPMTGTVMIIR